MVSVRVQQPHRPLCSHWGIHGSLRVRVRARVRVRVRVSLRIRVRMRTSCLCLVGCVVVVLWLSCLVPSCLVLSCYVVV